MSGDELLQLLLEHGLDGARARVAGDSAARAELDELASFVERCRRELAEPGDARLVAAVLARTTRADPSWRGDLALVGRFVLERLESSPLARLAAALLIVPLLGGPVLAWVVWKAVRAPEGFITGIEIEQVEPFLPAAPEPPADGVVFPWSEDPFVDLDGNRDTLVVSLPAEARAAQTRAAGARALDGAIWPRLTGDGPLARAFALRAGANPEATPAPAATLARADRALLAALRVEALLDRWAREGRAPAELGAALVDLGRESEAPLDVRRLEALALERARAYGRVDGDAWARLAHSGARPGERAHDDPLDRPWRANLAAALRHSSEGRALLADPDVAGWLEQRQD